MAKRAKLKKTIARVGYAPLNYYEESGAIRFGTVTWFVHNEAGGREYASNANGETTEVYADGMSIYTSDENHGYDIDLTLVSVIDDIDVCWLGNEVDENGVVAEFANNLERPRFALIIIEDTTDGIGMTHIWYNCIVPTRPSFSGKTSDDSGFDPQFFDVSVQARPIGTSKIVYARLPQKNTFNELPLPSGSALASFSLSGATLTPAFRSDVDTYTFTASGTTVSVTEAVPIAPNGFVTIKQNDDTISIGDAITVASGAITVTISTSIAGSESTRTYTFTPET